MMTKKIQKAINATNYKEQNLKILHISSLRKQTCISHQQYNNILLSIVLLEKYGSEYRVHVKGWLTFLEGLYIDAEFSSITLWKRIVGRSKRGGMNAIEMRVS